ncbi:MAG: hypothetical protein GOU97_04730 [Nanoarchaeota archaeon]|nr:hypothetical protein [Nanoarchaeota archaeon]
MDIDLMTTRERYELFCERKKIEEMDPDIRNMYLEHYKKKGFEESFRSVGITLRYPKEIRCAVNLPSHFEGLLNFFDGLKEAYEFQKNARSKEEFDAFVKGLFDVKEFADFFLTIVSNTINHESLHAVMFSLDNEFKHFSWEYGPDECYSGSEHSKAHHLIIELMLVDEMLAFNPEEIYFKKFSVDELYSKSWFKLARYNLEKKLEKMF